MIYESNYYNSGYALLAADSGMLNQDTIKYFDLDNVIEASEELVMAPVKITDGFKEDDASAAGTATANTDVRPTSVGGTVRYDSGRGGGYS